MTSWNIRDKTVVITGPTAGIGRVTARTLAERGAKLILVARDRPKVETLARELGGAEIVVADLSIRSEVERAANELLAAAPKIEVLINNAGAIFSDRQLTQDGLEKTFALNHMAYFHLTKRLLDRIRASAPARIVNVASAAHYRAKLDLDDLQCERGWGGRKQYERSKLMNVMFTYELARKLEGSGVTANCLHPGVIASDFGKSAPGVVKTFFTLAAPFLTTTEKGAATTIMLATSPELSNTSGRYFSEGHEKESSRESHDREKAARLWAKSDALVSAT